MKKLTAKQSFLVIALILLYVFMALRAIPVNAQEYSGEFSHQFERLGCDMELSTLSAGTVKALGGKDYDFLGPAFIAMATIIYRTPELSGPRAEYYRNELITDLLAEGLGYLQFKILF